MATHLAFKRAGQMRLHGQLVPVEHRALDSVEVSPTGTFGVVQNFVAPLGETSTPHVLVVAPDVDVWLSIRAAPTNADKKDKVAAGSRVHFAVHAGDQVGITTAPPANGTIA